MKKKLVVITVFLILVIIVLFSGLPYEFYKRELRTHNIGYIKLSVNGNVLSITDTEVQLENYLSKTRCKLNNGSFQKKEGSYGENYYRLILSPEFCVKHIDPVLEQGLTVIFGFFNTNWWHKNIYNLNIDFNNEDERLKYNIIQNIVEEDTKHTKIIEGELNQLQKQGNQYIIKIIQGP